MSLLSSTPSILTNLESIDKPSQLVSYPSEFGVLNNQDDKTDQQVKRVSRLPPPPTIPQSWGRNTPAGPSRYYFVAVRRGHQPGVYPSWAEAEKQVSTFPCPVYKTFSTRLAAEAYVSGWNGAGRHSLPSSSPRPLREHLAMNFPNAVPLSNTPKSSSRLSYHARLLSSPSLQLDSMMVTDFGPSDDATARPGLPHRHSAPFRHSLVKISSPLRHQVDDNEAKPVLRKTTSFMGIGGMLSPPSSPESSVRPPPLQTSVMNRQRPIQTRSIHETGTWSSTQHKQFPNKPLSMLPSPPHSPPTQAKRPPPKRSASGLWADSAPTPSVPAEPTAKNGLEVDFTSNMAAPKFSRSALKKSGVVMPVSAPRSNSSSSLSSLLNKSSTPSLRSSPSTTSLNSVSSYNSFKPVRKQPHVPHDRLQSLAETSRKELSLNKEGLLALDALSPPRPAFMHRKSNSSISSLSSMTSATSAQASSIDSFNPIMEEVEVVISDGNDEEVPISCTKSDADADGSVESSSMKSGINGKEKKKGGLFKRLSKALKLEKKTVPGQEGGRRGSL